MSINIPTGNTLTENEMVNVRDDIRTNLEDYYLTALTKVAFELKATNTEIRYSELELSAAIDEAIIDIRAMWTRRNPQAGLSRGKIAGMFAFRLARFKIINFLSDDDQPTYAIFQEIVALVFVLERVLRVNADEQFILEMAYQMSRRHMNQETLALAFDIIYGTTIKTADV